MSSRLRKTNQQQSKKTLKFVVLTIARSGSTWLTDTIDHIEGIVCLGELFHHRLVFLQFSEGQKVETFQAFRERHPGIRPFVTFRYLDEIFRKNNAVGFKLLVNQLRRFPEVFLYMLVNQVSYIHLVRENTLDILVSKKTAWERGKFIYKTGEEIPPETTLVYPIDELLSELERTERRTSQTRSLLKLLRARRIEVKYEDLLKGPQAFEPIWKFLGIDFESNPPKWEVQKTRKKKLSELIANYSEVEQALSGTKFSRHIASEPRTD